MPSHKVSVQHRPLNRNPITSNANHNQHKTNTLLISDSPKWLPRVLPTSLHPRAVEFHLPRQKATLDLYHNLLPVIRRTSANDWRMQLMFKHPKLKSRSFRYSEPQFIRPDLSKSIQRPILRYAPGRYSLSKLQLLLDDRKALTVLNQTQTPTFRNNQSIIRYTQRPLLRKQSNRKSFPNSIIGILTKRHVGHRRSRRYSLSLLNRLVPDRTNSKKLLTKHLRLPLPQRCLCHRTLV